MVVEYNKKAATNTVENDHSWQFNKRTNPTRRQLRRLHTRSAQLEKKSSTQNNYQ
jgi:hypothetical protein